MVTYLQVFYYMIIPSYDHVFYLILAYYFISSIFSSNNLWYIFESIFNFVCFLKKDSYILSTFSMSCILFFSHTLFIILMVFFISRYFMVSILLFYFLELYITFNLILSFSSVVLSHWSLNRGRFFLIDSWPVTAFANILTVFLFFPATSMFVSCSKFEG